MKISYIHHQTCGLARQLWDWLNQQTSGFNTKHKNCVVKHRFFSFTKHGDGTGTWRNIWMCFKIGWAPKYWQCSKGEPEGWNQGRGGLRSLDCRQKKSGVVNEMTRNFQRGYRTWDDGILEQTQDFSKPTRPVQTCHVDHKKWDRMGCEPDNLFYPSTRLRFHTTQMMWWGSPNTSSATLVDMGIGQSQT